MRNIGLYNKKIPHLISVGINFLTPYKCRNRISFDKGAYLLSFFKIYSGIIFNFNI
jgi:hypothetical protein